MRALIVPAVNGPWEVKDVQRPAPGPNQVLIQIKASGLCYTDVHITRGALPTKFPRTLGHEPVGVIVETGSAVRTRKVGDRVGVPWVQATCGRCEWCLRGKGLFCPEQIGTGVECPGSHAEFMTAFADATVPIPESVSFEDAAPIFCAGYTVWSGLRIAEPRPGEAVAVVGVGGLGHLAVQYARAAGFVVRAVSHSPDKADLIRRLGADAVVADGEGLARAGGADVILATGNSWKAAQDAMKGLRPDGRLVLMGLSDEPFVLAPSLLMNRQRVLGSLQNNVEHLYEAIDFVARGRVRPRTEVYPLSEIDRAYRRVAEGRVRFRAVVVP